jgi:hypothetical protein
VSHKIAVEVVYALPEKQYLQRVTLEDGSGFRHPRASQRYRPGEEQGRDLQPSGEAG